MQRRALAAVFVAHCSGMFAGAADESTGIAKLSYVHDAVERHSAGAWSRVEQGVALRSGDRLRTGPAASARLDFPWTTVMLSGGTRLSVPRARVLSMVLEEGRLEQEAAGETIKVVAGEATVRGVGRVVVRRENERTLVSVLSGSFTIAARGALLELAAAQGAIVAKGKGPGAAVSLPAAPTHLDPGEDPVYVVPAEPVSLGFRSRSRSHHLQLLSVETREVLLERDLGASPAQLVIPWEGTFRWRVSARGLDGLEGTPSAEGLIAAVTR